MAPGSQGEGGASRDRQVPAPQGALPRALSTCHMQLCDTRGVGTPQVQIQLPPDAQLWPTWPSISPCLAPHGHQIHENCVLWLILIWPVWVPGYFYNPSWAPGPAATRVWLPWKRRQLTKSSLKARPRCTPVPWPNCGFPKLGMPLAALPGQGSPLAMLLGTRPPTASFARARKRRRRLQFLPRVRGHRSSARS